MAFLLELSPVLAFFFTHKFYGIYYGTAVMLGASACQLLICGLQGKAVSTIQLASFVLLGLMGSATLIFQNPLFLKWKPTLLYWALGLVCLLHPYWGKATFAQSAFGHWVELPETEWKWLNGYWVGFFVIMGLLNLIVAYMASTNTWINFKLFGLSGIGLLFIIGQAVYLQNVTKSNLS